MENFGCEEMGELRGVMSTFKILYNRVNKPETSKK
jgi:hypothetical protein